VPLISWLRQRWGIAFEQERCIEIVFLCIATLHALLIKDRVQPGTTAAHQLPAEIEVEGPAAVLKPRAVWLCSSCLAFAAGVILANAKILN
jgi:hypothetical protein